MEDLTNDFERAEYLQNMLIASATGGTADNAHYQELRAYFLERADTKELLPSFVRTNRNLAQFWQYIKFKFSSYAERRQFIWSQFAPLFELLETGNKIPADASVSETLKRFDKEGVHTVWARALDRRKSDPEGAITAARTLLESVCKHILDEQGVDYNDNKAELPQLYHLVSMKLNLSPSQHTEEVFKQILGSCSTIVNNLCTLRNRLGDAHGKGKAVIVPAARHAELAVNLAGSLALFLVETWEARHGEPK
jgi:uncharacterized protein YfkK (UPF0435 family)